MFLVELRITSLKFCCDLVLRILLEASGNVCWFQYINQNSRTNGAILHVSRWLHQIFNVVQFVKCKLPRGISKILLYGAANLTIFGIPDTCRYLLV